MTHKAKPIAAPAKKKAGKGKAAPVKKTGRPSVFSESVANKVIEGLVASKSLRTVCQADDMPHISTVIRWLADDRNVAFRAQYTHAREVQAEIYAAETIEIADDGTRDVVMTANGPAVDHDHIARSRLRVDSRKWYASKLAPKKYGDKLALGGDEQMPPIKVDANVTLSPSEAYLRMVRGYA